MLRVINMFICVDPLIFDGAGCADIRIAYIVYRIYRASMLCIMDIEWRTNIGNNDDSCPSYWPSGLSVARLFMQRRIVIALFRSHFIAEQYRIRHRIIIYTRYCRRIDECLIIDLCWGTLFGVREYAEINRKSGGGVW